MITDIDHSFINLISWRNKCQLIENQNQEIEIKFSVPKNYSAVLLQNGATLINEKILEDGYFDTEDFHLLKINR